MLARVVERCASVELLFLYPGVFAKRWWGTDTSNLHDVVSEEYSGLGC
jgi:hypothetical protein